ncbi:pyridoxine/pyridoxal/pyridoxamine kinase [Paludifilum halophilum]|uniref:pyridoxal kinase n=1 Tax=Paludifilum halophilum TaxID=1642702 RepID=A0A235B7S1_9BACL|nr:pyridoxine/pyridoxal/pyridoxamine kinase [Paludifilum halophilum]OYD08363.1 bifunctional hydroxymethylpyrimidine kinase/phosphomethylpyrimidine kinase [Paludifilum halophilum]
MTMYKALTIAGSDSSGGAGIQADLKTFQELGIYGMTAQTTIVAMDPRDRWFHRVFPVDPDTVKAQLETIVEGVGVDAVKTGMLGSPELIELAAQMIREHRLQNVVIDPVMVCKGADEELHPENTASLREVLVPEATVVTPNLFEAAKLSRMSPITTLDEMKEAAVAIHRLGAKYVLVKGGSQVEHEQAVDLLYDGETFTALESEKIDTPYTHGAGCTYSAAVTAELAKGKTVRDAVETAKSFITEAIRHSFRLNEYVGPINPAAYRRKHR